ncbi:MAG TPA: signal peptidase II [Spirochaetia bacterium]|nr:signal peptidase II [Spirochaetia bacterium]HTZ50234.1 signal peptidase II [Spirochaetia bacterium]
MDPRRVKALVAVLIVLAAMGWDQASKHVARARLEGKPPAVVAHGVLTLVYAENEGAFLSLGARLPRPARTVAFIAFPLVVLAWMIVSLTRRQGLGWGMLAGFSLIVGGGSGNLIDRLFHGGRVGDFLMVGIGGLHTGIFNFADMAVMAGCIVLLLAPSRGRAPRAPADPAPGSSPAPPTS